MTAREELEAVAAEEGWALAVPLHKYAVYVRDELILSTELGNPPPWTQLACGARRWTVRQPDAVLETALAWLRFPYDTVHGQRPQPAYDPLVERVRDVFDRFTQLERSVLAYADELDRMPDTGLIGPGTSAARLRAIVKEAL